MYLIHMCSLQTYCAQATLTTSSFVQWYNGYLAL